MHFQQSNFQCTPETQQALVMGLWERGAYVLPSADGKSIQVVGNADSWKDVRDFIRSPNPADNIIPPDANIIPQGEPADGVTQPGKVDPNPPDSNVSIHGVDIPGELNPNTVVPPAPPHGAPSA